VEQGDLRELELGKQELSEFGSHLSKLRDLLARLQKVSFRNVQVATGGPASVYSPSSLGLDFGAGDDTSPISSVAALSGVSSGTFEINGVSISVTVGSDSLRDVADRINTSAAGVTASLNESIDGLVLVSDDRKQTIELTEGSSNFFSALGIGTGRHAPSTLSEQTFRSPNRARGLLRQVVEELNQVFRGDFDRLDADLLEEARTDLQGAITDALGLVLGDTSGDRLRSGLGLDFNFSNASPEAVSFRTRQFARASADDFKQLAEFLFGKPTDGDPGGFAPALIDKLDEIAGSLVQNLAGSLTQGALADVSA
jgi:hypothetical protein